MGLFIGNFSHRETAIAKLGIFGYAQESFNDHFRITNTRNNGLFCWQIVNLSVLTQGLMHGMGGTENVENPF